jgi:hypothetical protein
LAGGGDDLTGPTGALADIPAGSGVGTGSSGGAGTTIRGGGAGVSSAGVEAGVRA